jgi:hypothetical protein
LSVCITFPLSTHPIMNTYIDSISWQLWIILWLTWEYRHFFTILVLLPLDIYPVVWLLGHTVILFSWITFTLFSIALALICIHTNSVQIYSLFCTSSPKLLFGSGHANRYGKQCHIEGII